MRTLYVVTHPEATHRVERVVGGQFDSELTARGHREASAIAQRLAEILPGEVEVELFTSDLRRTVQTAEAIGTTLDLHPVHMSDLREKSYGIAGGKPQQWLDDRFIPPPAVGERMHHDDGIEGAETRAELAQRAYRAVERIVARECAHQIIVTHGTALTFVICAWIRMPIEAADYVSFRSTSGPIRTLRTKLPREGAQRAFVRSGGVCIQPWCTTPRPRTPIGASGRVAATPGRSLRTPSAAKERANGETVASAGSDGTHRVPRR